MMSEVGYNFYPEPPKSDYSDSVEGAFTIDATGSEDTFGLEFAVSQWLKLVTNAENLFSKLVTSKFLSDDEKTQIEIWLSLKQECEECVVASDDAASLRGCNARVLERIDELTESDLKTEKSSDIERHSPGDNSFENDSETESDLEQNPDFVEKLDRYMNKLRVKTDEKIDYLNSNLMSNFLNKKMALAYISHVKDSTVPENKKSAAQEVKTPSTQYGGTNVPRRRRSIHPGTEAESVVNQLNFKSLHEKTDVPYGLNDENASNNMKEKSTRNNETSQEGEGKKREKEAPTVLPYIPYLEDAKPGPSEELRMLSAGNEAKQSQMCQVLIDLEGAQRRIEELQRTIQLKEQFIENMVKNDKMRATAKQRFRRKRIKLESEYYKTRTLIAEAEDNLMVAHENNLKDDEVKCQREIERFKSEAILYEKRLKNIEIMKHIAENSARKMLELENSLQKSRCQMDRLKKQLKKEEEYKHVLEEELLQDQCKIRELEEKYSVQNAKYKTSKKAECRLKFIQEEEERVLNMRESSQRFQEQLIQKQIMLERREAFLKQRLCLEKSKTKNISEVSARISQLHQVLKEKSADCERIDYEKEALRHEIGNLRRTRDCLVDQRCNLDEKFQKKTLSNVEERKLLECEEAIEAIDAAIEYKNELICGRNSHTQELNNSEVPREMGEELLLARLMQLSPIELRSLLYKYFKKVIDLRENTKNMEIQLSELDIQNESQKWKIQALSNALQQAHLKAERHIVMLQKEHEEEMALMLRYFAEESSGSSGPEVPEKPQKPPKPPSKGHWKSNGPSTTVTKEGKKLIFQQQKARKTPKR